MIFQAMRDEKAGTLKLLNNLTDQIEWLEEKIDDYEPGSDEYAALMSRLSEAYKSRDILIRENEPFWRKEFFWKTLQTVTVVGTSALQSVLIFKISRDGYLIKQDVAKIQMPRPM